MILKIIFDQIEIFGWNHIDVNKPIETKRCNKLIEYQARAPRGI